MSVSDRNFQTKFHIGLSTGEWEVVNRIVDRKVLEQQENGGVSLWDINIMHHATAITVISWKGKLREKSNRQEQSKLGWLIQMESRIGAIRKKLSDIDSVSKCKDTNTFSKHQRDTEKMLKHWYGNTRRNTLLFRKTHLKQSLKVESEKMRRKKVFTERRKINNTFHLNPIQVYRKFRATSEIEVKDAPTKQQIQKFWGDIWQRSKEHNKEAE